MLHRIARPLFATWFVVEGVRAVVRPAEHVAAVRQTVARKVAWVPASRQLLAAADEASDQQLSVAVRAHGAALALAGLALAAGKAPRTAATTLAVLTGPLLVPTLLPPRSGGTKDETRARRARRVQLLSAVGGALIAAGDTEGRPGVRWRVATARAQRAADRTQSA